MKRDDSGKSRGYGFIRYADYEAQERVIGKAHFIEGRRCEVKIPHSKAGGVSLMTYARYWQRVRRIWCQWSSVETSRITFPSNNVYLKKDDDFPTSFLFFAAAVHYAVSTGNIQTSWNRNDVLV